MSRPSSMVAAGDGVADPDEVSVYRAWDEEAQVTLVIEWAGGEYDQRDCWIQAETGAFLDLDTAV